MQSAHRSDDAAFLVGLWPFLSDQGHGNLLGPRTFIYEVGSKFEDVGSCS